MYAIDSTDQQLLSLLRENARYTIAELAQRLQVSRGTVTNRLHRLETQGVIKGYTVLLREDSTPEKVCAWTSIVIKGNMTLQVVKALRGEPCVTGIYDTSGRWDILVALEASSLAQLGQALERIRSIENISKSETSIHLKNYL